MIKTNYTDAERKEIIQKFIKYLSFLKTKEISVDPYKKTEKAVFISLFVSDFRNYKLDCLDCKPFDELENSWNFDVSFWLPKKFCWQDKSDYQVTRFVAPTWILIKRLEEEIA